MEHFISGDLVFAVADRNYDDQMKLQAEIFQRVVGILTFAAYDKNNRKNIWKKQKST